MKIFLKVIILLLICFVISTVTPSCNKCKSSHYRIDAVVGKANTIIGKSASYPLFPAYLFGDYGKTAHFDSLVFSFTFLGSNHYVSTWNFGFTEVLACKPNFSSDDITIVRITSNKNYNQQYMAGMDLQNIMSTWQNSANQSDSLKNSSERFGSYGSSIMFKIKEQPTESQSHDFTFTFQISSGKVIESTIRNIFIVK